MLKKNVGTHGFYTYITNIMTISSKDLSKSGLTGVARRQQEEAQKRLDKQLMEFLLARSKKKKKKEPKKKK